MVARGLGVHNMNQDRGFRRRCWKWLCRGACNRFLVLVCIDSGTWVSTAGKGLLFGLSALIPTAFDTINSDMLWKVRVAHAVFLWLVDPLVFLKLRHRPTPSRPSIVREGNHSEHMLHPSNNDMSDKCSQPKCPYEIGASMLGNRVHGNPHASR